jgi:hypothetical protein
LDRKTRKHHPKADIDCLYFPRKQGGRGLIQLEEAYMLEIIIKLMEYEESKADPLIQIVGTHQRKTNSTISFTCFHRAFS